MGVLSGVKMNEVSLIVLNQDFEEALEMILFMEWSRGRSADIIL